MKTLKAFSLLLLVCALSLHAVTRLSDGFTLQYVDTLGQTQIVGAMDTQRYLEVLAVFQAQQQSLHDNNAAVAGYINALSNYQGWLNNGSIGATQAAPTKPLKVLIDDQGNVTHIPFAPALPDPVQPTFTPSSNSIRSNNAPPDRTDLLLMLVQDMQKKLAAIQAKLGVQ